MSGFFLEDDLPHQNTAIASVLGVFANVDLDEGTATERLLSNPKILIGKNQLFDNIKAVQQSNGILSNKDTTSNSNVLDISMETGTGKTFTYTRTILELNKHLNINKFVIVVPTLPIKAGTINFLKSDTLKDFARRQEYGREIMLYVVEQQKKVANKSKSYMPQVVTRFVNASSVNTSNIHIMVINAGMLNSDTLHKTYDTSIFDHSYNSPVDAIKAVRPFVIIDEPHRFPTGKKTWANIEKLSAQFIIRYGATFSEGYKNLLYRLNAVDAFNMDLVKGINAFVEHIEGEDTVVVRLKRIDEHHASFELNDNGSKKTFNLSKGQSFSLIHPMMHDLKIENMNRNVVVLSNGNEIAVGAMLNPYSYSDTLQDNMMQNAIKRHFEIEADLITRTPRIKPLTLFFIDDIAGYRVGNNISGTLKHKFETWLVAEAKNQLSKTTDQFYKTYLEKTIADPTIAHGGYFSKDNVDKDEKIEKEIYEILHDKELLLSIDNHRRFLFSKWTLREGFDNPNIFNICKLRTSGSNTSKLQEVGRGLRLPVNQFLARVKSEEFKLNYFVDFTESDFVNQLIGEINKSSEKETAPTKLTELLKQVILDEYPELSAFDIIMDSVSEGIIDKNEAFKEGGYEKLKEKYSKAFGSSGKLKAGKIQIAGAKKQTTHVRTGLYEELKELWESINHKAILEYKIDSEEQFESLFINYLLEEAVNFKKSGIKSTMQQLYIRENIMTSKVVELSDQVFSPISTMKYGEFVYRLSSMAFIRPATVHSAFLKCKDHFDITQYLNIQTVRKIRTGFNRYLLNNAFTKFEVGYKLVRNSIHPTKITDETGQPLLEVQSSGLGVYHDGSVKPADNFLFEDVFFDSDLERENTTTEIQSITVFTKIPKNSIRIPVAGGGTYSPDFAYILKTNEGEILNFVIETKKVEDKEDLRKAEQQKIAHAEKLFNQISKTVKVKFLTQFSADKIAKLIKENLFASPP